MNDTQARELVLTALADVAPEIDTPARSTGNVAARRRELDSWTSSRTSLACQRLSPWTCRRMTTIGSTP